MASEVKPRKRNPSGQFTKKAAVPELTEDMPPVDDEVAALRAELAEAKADAERWKPTVDITDRLFETTDDVAERFNYQDLKDIAGAEIAQINLERLKRGHLPIDYDEAEWETEIDRVKLDLIADRTRWVAEQGAAARVLKMVKPVKDRCDHQPCYKHGSLVQIPVENQINNQAGSLSDGTQRYKDKGYKLCRPFLCAMVECWEPAKISDGKFLYAGYCTEAHRARVEGNQGAAVVSNVITRTNVI